MKRITREMVAAARARASAQIAGTYEAPPPVKATRASRFMPRLAPRPLSECRTALYDKSGQPNGSRGRG